MPPTNLDFRSIAFSPADDYVYYTQIREDFSLNTLYQIPTLGGTPKKLIEDVDSGVSFSPDGKRFAFIRHASKNSEDTIFIGSTENSNLETLISSRAAGYDFFSMYLAWSPDGAKILTGAGKKQSGFVSETKIAEVSVADKTLKILPSKDFYTAENFCWFKDGSGFLFTAQESRAAPSQIWRAAYPSGSTFHITNDFNNYTEIGLSADGTTVVTVQGESVSSLWRYSPSTKVKRRINGGQPHLFRLPLDGAPQQPLTDFKSGKILNFAWSNDGKSVFVVRGITNNDLILIREAAINNGK